MAKKRGPKTIKVKGYNYKRGNKIVKVPGFNRSKRRKKK